MRLWETLTGSGLTKEWKAAEARAQVADVPATIATANAAMPILV